MSERPSVRVERSQKWVRTYALGELVADTRRPLLVWERPYYPTYYIPVDDVRAKLVPTGEIRPARTPDLGPGQVLTVTTGRGELPGAARRHREAADEAVRDAVRLE